MTIDGIQAASLRAELARDPDLPGLQTRWGVLTSKKAPPHVPKNPLLRLLAYRLQATALDDLDPATLRYLERIVAAGKASPPVALPAPTRSPPVPQVACFDTAFHQTQPDIASLYRRSAKISPRCFSSMPRTATSLRSSRCWRSHETRCTNASSCPW